MKSYTYHQQWLLLDIFTDLIKDNKHPLDGVTCLWTLLCSPTHSISLCDALVRHAEGAGLIVVNGSFDNIGYSWSDFLECGGPVRVHSTPTAKLTDKGWVAICEYFNLDPADCSGSMDKFRRDSRDAAIDWFEGVGACEHQKQLGLSSDFDRWVEHSCHKCGPVLGACGFRSSGGHVVCFNCGTFQQNSMDPAQIV